MKKIRKGFKFELLPKRKHLEPLDQALGANRFVWNKLLGMNLRRLEQGQPLIWYNEMAWFITLWASSEEYRFLADAPSQSLQQTARALAKAFKDAFDKNQPRKRLPVFKKLGRREAGIKYPQHFKIDENNQVVYLPKLGWVRYVRSRNIEGIPKNVTVSRHAGKYYVSIQTEREVVQPVHPSRTIAGCDRGVVRFLATASTTLAEAFPGGKIAGADGNPLPIDLPAEYAFAPLDAFRKLEQKLAKAQRKLARMVKFSSNWKKQKQRIAKLHAHIANARLDYLHKVTTRMSQSHAIIVLEDLKVVNMTRSAKGTLEEPGRNVRQKAGLNKAILDQGWGLFGELLSYKMDWLGGWVLLVPPHHTSQRCPGCGHTAAENRTTQALFRCVECGFEDNADDVGAINVLVKGIVLLADPGHHKEYQEPRDHAGIACPVSGARRPPATGTASKSRKKAKASPAQ